MAQPGKVEPSLIPKSEERSSEDILAERDTRGTVPGTPKDTIEKLKKIYKAINIYRIRHAGEYPANPMSILTEVGQHLEEYGFVNFMDALHVFTTPDSRYAGFNPDSFVPYIFMQARQDGSPLGGPKPLGTRDVLAYTSIYYHPNVRLSPARRTIKNPAGFYLVLWDDGQVEKVPYDTILLVPRGNNRVVIAFPGQAGVPSTCFTYDDFWSLGVNGGADHTQLPPRGKPIPKDQTSFVPDNGGPESLVALSHVLGQALERERVWEVFSPEKEEFSLQDIQIGAQKLGLSLANQEIPLEEIKRRGGAAILHLREPDRLITVASIGTLNSVIYDGGMAHVVDNKTLSQRYAGDALLSGLLKAQTTVQIDEPVHILEIKPNETEITQKVLIKNQSQRALELQIEQPICGCTEATISSNLVAPGEMAVLSVTIKPDKNIKVASRSIFLSMHTNDTVKPRLILGFNVKTAQP